MGVAVSVAVSRLIGRSNPQRLSRFPESNLVPKAGIEPARPFQGNGF